MFHARHDPSINITALMQAKRQQVKRPGKRLVNFDREAIEQVLTYCDTIRNDLQALRDRAFVLTLADTGLRISEACSLTRGMIDWREQRAIVTGKGDKDGLIRFSNRSIDAMKEYLQARAKLDGASGKPLSSLPIFARHDKRVGSKIVAVKPGGMWFAVKERCKEAGIDPERIRVHDFRHYFVTIVYASTHDLIKTKEWARHESEATTSRYTHLIDVSGEEYSEIFNKR
jgi:integrase